MMFNGTRGEKAPALALNHALKEHRAMKLLTGWGILAGLVGALPAANAQVPARYEFGGPPYAAASDLEGPYAAMPEQIVVPRYGPSLLPPQEVYTVVRESGFSPLGAPQQRGFFYTISVIDRGGDDGRLVIDARNGRIVRFMPAYRMGDNLNDAVTTTYGPVGPPVSAVRSGPRPPASIPHSASRKAAVPLPKASPSQAGDVNSASPNSAAAKPAAEPPQRSAAVDAKSRDPQTGMQAGPPPAAEVKRATPQILPTQEMPDVQGLN
jgi:hypothetical protein